MRDVLNKEGVVENDNLSGKVFGTDSGLVLGVGGDIPTLDILGRDVLDVESDIVSGGSFWHGQENAVFDGVDIERKMHRECVNSTKKLRQNVDCRG